MSLPDIPEPHVLVHMKFYLELTAALLAVIFGGVAIYKKLRAGLSTRRISQKFKKGRTNKSKEPPIVKTSPVVFCSVFLLLFSPFLIAAIATYYREHEVAQNWVCGQIAVMVGLGILSMKPPSWADIGFILILSYLILLSQNIIAIEQQYEFDLLNRKAAVAQARYERARDNLEDSKNWLKQSELNQRLLELFMKAHDIPQAQKDEIQTEALKND